MRQIVAIAAGLTLVGILDGCSSLLAPKAPDSMPRDLQSVYDNIKGEGTHKSRGYETGIVVGEGKEHFTFEILIANQGLKKVNSSSLELSIENQIVRTFEIGDIDIGAKRQLTVSNLRVPRSTEKITFIVKTSEPEISKDNNQVDIFLQTQ